MRIAVTGANGHVGANVIRDLQQHGFHVRALVYPGSDLAAVQAVPVETVLADVLDRRNLEQVLRGFDVVVNLAAVISISGDPEGRVMQTNVRGTRNVAQTCLEVGVAKLVHMSSIHAFKISPSLEKVDEFTPKADNTGFVYDRSKAAGEQEIQAAVKDGLDATILNPTGIIGPHDYCTSLSGLMLRKLFLGKMFALIDAGFDWIDVRDVASAVRATCQAGRTGEQYLLSGHWVSFRELARHCEMVSGTPAPRVVLPWWIGLMGLPLQYLQTRFSAIPPIFTYEALVIARDSNRNCCSEKARRELGFRTRPLSETIRDTYEWSRQYGVI